MLKLIFRSSWKVQAFLAVLCFALATLVFFGNRLIEAEKAQALKDGIPAPVSLNAFDPKRDIHAADEVHVVGWLNPDYNYLLTETTKTKRGSYDTVRRMFVLLGPEDGADSKIARAVVLLPEGAVDQFLTDMAANVQTVDETRLVFQLNGTAEKRPTLHGMADDALAKLGVSKAAGFQFIEPWDRGGREAALAPDPDTGKMISMAIAGFGGLLLFVAVAKLRKARSPLGQDVRLSGQSAKPAPIPAAEKSVPGSQPELNATLHKQERDALPRWLVPAFILTLMACAAYVIGVSVISGLVFMGILWLGVVQAKRMVGSAANGLARAVVSKTDKTSSSAEQNSGPVTSVAGSFARISSVLKPSEPKKEPSTAVKAVSIAVALVFVLFGNSIFKTGDAFGVQSLTNKPMPVAVTIVNENKVDELQISATVPVAQEADPAPEAASPNDPKPAPIGVTGKLDPRLLVLIAAVVAVGAGLFAFLRKSGISLRRANTKVSSDDWPRLDRIVARERAIAVKVRPAAQMAVQA